MDSGRVLAFPLVATASCQLDPDVWHAWEHRFGTPDYLKNSHSPQTN